MWTESILKDKLTDKLMFDVKMEIIKMYDIKGDIIPKKKWMQ